REGFVENSARKRLGGFSLNLPVQKFLCLGLMAVDPVGELDVGLNPFLDQIGMSLEELGIHDQQADNKLSVGPQRAFVDEQAAVAFMNQARGPGFGRPGGIEIFFQEERQLVGIGHGDNLHVAALVVGFEAVILE